MTEQYTPTTTEMREMYVRADRGVRSREEYESEFQRWLAERDRQVAEKAYERAILDVGLNPDLANQFLDTNPYRKAVQS